MANNFESAATNYGHNFANNAGNHYYTTNGHKLADSGYVITTLGNAKSLVSPSPTKLHTTLNNTTTYGANEIVNNYKTVDNTLLDAYTQASNVRFDTNNINTKGSITGELNFRIHYSVMSPGDTLNGIELTYPNFVGTTDTRGYRYSTVTVTPVVYANAALDDDGTNATNATVVPFVTDENGQGFLNYPEPKLIYELTLSYLDNTHSNRNWFRLSYTDTIPSIHLTYDTTYRYGSRATFRNTFTYFYSGFDANKSYSYSYAPYGHLSTSKNPGPSWLYNKIQIITEDNYLSTYPRELALTYDKNAYWNISYDGVTDMPIQCAFMDTTTTPDGTVTVITYKPISTTNRYDYGLTSYTRSFEINHNIYSLSNSTDSPTLGTPANTVITQDGARLRFFYRWDLPEKDGSYLNNYDPANGNAKYVSFTKENIWCEGNNIGVVYGSYGYLTVSKQMHHMGSVTGNLDFSFVPSDRIVHLTEMNVIEGTFGTLSWTDCENTTERFFYPRVAFRVDNCRNQNITSATNEYYDTSKSMPMVTAKFRQLPANWMHPGLGINVKLARYNTPADTRFNGVNPCVVSYTKINDFDTNLSYVSYDGATSNWSWNIKGHPSSHTSTIDASNSKLAVKVFMPTVPETTRVNAQANGNVTASVGTAYLEPNNATTHITPTWNINYQQGYRKGYSAAQWKLSCTGIEGHEQNTGQTQGNGLGMSYSGVKPFNDFIIQLDAKSDYSFTYPQLTLGASVSTARYPDLTIVLFALNRISNVANDLATLTYGHQSIGFDLTGPDNTKKGTQWSASLNKNTYKVEYNVGNYYSTPSISTKVNFSLEHDSYTDGTITAPDPITVTVKGDTWSAFNIRWTCTSEKAGHALKNPTTSNTQSINPPNYLTATLTTTDTITSDGLVDAHQLKVTGIGTLASADHSATASTSSWNITTSGNYATESANSHTYVSNFKIWCNNASTLGVPYYPNTTNKSSSISPTVTGTWQVDPLPASAKIQYYYSGAWHDTNSFSFGTNYGSATSASSTTNSNAAKDGPFKLTPSRYDGSSTRTSKYKVGVYDNNTKQRYESSEYTLTQSGTSAYYYSTTFTFTTSSTTRCSVSSISSVTTSTVQDNKGAFTVTPASNPFDGLTEADGMSNVVSTIKTAVTSGSDSITINASDKNFKYDETVSLSVSVTADDSITVDNTGSCKYDFTYSATVTCSPGSATKTVSGTASSEWTPSANATKYTLKINWGDGTTNTTKTHTYNKVGSYTIRAYYVNGSDEWKNDATKKIEITQGSQTLTTYYRLDSVSLTSGTPYKTKAASLTVTPTLSFKVSSKTVDQYDAVISDWKSYDSTDAVTLNATSHTFSDMDVNTEYTYTFVATAADWITDYATGVSETTEHKVTVTRESTTSTDTDTERRTYCTMTASDDKTITYFDDITVDVSCTFTATKQHRTRTRTVTDGTAGAWSAWSAWSDDGTDNTVTINASSSTITATSCGTSESTTGDNSFTFTLSGGTYTPLQGTTSVTVHVYRYGVTYHNE